MTATVKQTSFIKTLVAERDVTGSKFENAAGNDELLTYVLSILTPKQASDAITELLALPKRATAPRQALWSDIKTEQAELEAGIYTDGTLIFKVYRAVHGSQKMCAKQLVCEMDEEGAFFEYRGLAARFVTDAFHRMTLDEAKAFGAIYGVCCNCGRTLTDEKSIEAGIGPVCSKRFA